MSSTPQDIGQSTGRHETKFHENLDRYLVRLGAALLALIGTAIFAISYCVNLAASFDLQYRVAFGIVIVFSAMVTMALVTSYTHKTIVMVVEYLKQ